MRVKTRSNTSEVMLTDDGFGVSQVHPVITLLHCVPEGSMVLLEQPERHLHPLAQAGLADVLIDFAQHRNVQIVFESHFRPQLLRLQRRLAEARVIPDMMALKFCQEVGNGGSNVE